MLNPSAQFATLADEISGQGYVSPVVHSLASLLPAMSIISSWRRAHNLRPFKMGFLLQTGKDLYEFERALLSDPDMKYYATHPQASLNNGVVEIHGIPIALVSEK